MWRDLWKPLSQPMMLAGVPLRSPGEQFNHPLYQRKFRKLVWPNWSKCSCFGKFSGLENIHWRQLLHANKSTKMISVSRPADVSIQGALGLSLNEADAWYPASNSIQESRAHGVHTCLTTKQNHGEHVISDIFSIKYVGSMLRTLLVARRVELWLQRREETWRSGLCEGSQKNVRFCRLETALIRQQFTQI